MSWLILSVASLIATAPSALGEEETAQEADFASGIETQKTPESVEVIDLGWERFSRLTVPVSIGEHGTFNFMVDTGAQATVLSLGLADRIGLDERGSATLIGMASTRRVEIAQVHSLSLGSRTFDIARVPLVEQQFIGSADGILGLDSLQDQRVLLDFKENKLAVADADSLGGNSGFEIIVRARRELGQLIITSATVDGVRVSVMIDTGAQVSIGNKALERQLKSQRTGETEMLDINGAVAGGNMGRAGLIKIGDAAIDNASLVFFDSPTFAVLGLADEPAMVLGMNELRLFERVAIDFKEDKIYFDLPRGKGWMDDFLIERKLTF